MKSYSTLRNLYSSITGRSASADLLLADQLLNDGYRKALQAVPHLREKLVTLSTSSGTQYIALPYDFEQALPGAYLTIGSQRYPLKPSPSREHFNAVAGFSSTSDYAEWYFIEASTKRIYLDRIPATSRSNVLTLPYKRRVKDLSVADYTTGTVSATSGSTTVTGSGTVWTSRMAGRFIRLTDGDSTSSGDGEWYEISSVTNSTTLVLAQSYGGTTVTGSNYTIGQMPLLPEDYHDLPLDWALYRYYKSKNDTARANEHLAAFKDSLQELAADYQRTDSPVISDGHYQERSNPNLYLTL